MKHRVVELLVCPRCGAELSVLSAAETESRPRPDLSGKTPGCSRYCSLHDIRLPLPPDRDTPDCSGCYGMEVMSGSLVCERGHRHCIEGGVPRLLAEETSGKDERTSYSFGYEWLRFRVDMASEEREVFLSETQSGPGEFPGKLALDAGCGMGRFTAAAAELGAEVVGLDISPATRAAFEKTRNLPMMHVVRGDITRPPLRAGAFDIVYSLGVLHHAPDTRAALDSIVPLARIGGTVAFWVYGKAGKYEEFVSNPLEPGRAQFIERRPWLRRPYWLGLKARTAASDSIRAVTIRLPVPLLYNVCRLLVPLGAVPLIKHFTFSSHPDPRVRLQENFDWLSPPFQHKHTKEEVRAWICELGMREEKMLEHGLVPKVGFKARRES